MSSGMMPGANNARKPSARKGHRLRCPFHAKYPDKFRGHNSSCKVLGFETNARVVEHLKRAHGPVNPSGGGANPQVAVPGPPQASAAYEIERVTQEQLTLISNLARNSNVQKKWESIYHILFPGDEAVKPAYMASLEGLRDHARNPPEWLITKMVGAIGASQHEILTMMKNFLIFFDIVGGGPSTSPPSMLSPPLTQQGHSSTGTESLIDDALMEDIDLSFASAEGSFQLDAEFEGMGLGYGVDYPQAYNVIEEFTDRDLLL